MEVLKKGSKGASVKTLQTLLGLTADGDFGAKTEAAVKAWQKAHGLTADGIVGNKTWALLTASSESKAVDPSVSYNPISVHITPLTNRPILYLAIHFTAGSRSTSGSAVNTRHVFESRSASADFIVDDETMLQVNPDPKNYYCWAVGDSATNSTGGGSLVGKATNRNTISIEICSSLKAGRSAKYANTDGWYFTDAALANARRLAKILMAKYNIPIERVVRHYDISGKLCPGIIGWNDGSFYTDNGMRTTFKSSSEDWLKFKQSLL